MEYPRLTSRRNPVAKAAAALAASPKERREQGAFLCEGARLCRDAVLSDVKVLRCFFTEEAAEKYGAYLEPVLEACGEAFLVEPPVAQMLSSTKNSQGIFCVCQRAGVVGEGSMGLESDCPCLVLENIQDPGNLGAVLRTAEALGGFQIVLLGDCCDPLSPKALRASMGAVFRMGLMVEPSARELVSLLVTSGYTCHGAVPDRKAVSVKEINFTTGRHAVFIGNEGSGLTRETARLCGDLVTIPMGGRAESLNAAAAATILLWEMARKGAGER